MTNETFTGTLVGSAGSRLVIRDAELATVAPSTSTSPATPAPSAPTPSSSTRQLSVYLKMWRSSLPGLAAAARPGITEVRLAFLQGSPPTLVGWGSQTLDQVRADAAALRARGVLVTASVGGSGGAVDTRSRDAFVRGVAALHAQIGLDRIDWDVEASALQAFDVLAITQTLHDQFGLLATMAPNGGNVGQYLPVAVQLHRRGLLAAYGQQFYDAPVTLAAAQGRIAEAVQAGLPVSLLQIGMMVGSDARHWTITQCAANAAAIRRTYPGIGAYLWSEQHTEVTAWAAQVGTALA